MLDILDDEGDDSFPRRRNTHPFSTPSARTAPSLIHVKPNLSARVSEDPFESTLTNSDMSLRETEDRRSKIMAPFKSETDGSYLGHSALPDNVLHFELKKYELLKDASAKFKKPTLNQFANNPTTNDHPDSFFTSMKPVLLTAQIFAMLPVNGFLGPNYTGLRFKWLNWKIAYAILFLCGVAFIFSCSLSMNFKFGFSYERSSPLVFFLSVALANLLMLQLAKSWPQINQEFAEIEFRLSKFGYPKRMGLKFKILTAIFMVVALVEHGLAKCTEYMRVLPCSKTKGEFFSNMEAFFINNYYQVFSLMSYSLWKGVIIFFVNLVAAVTWNFTDLLLAVISTHLSERFKQMNTALFKIEGQEKPSSFWRTAREDYNELSVLTKRMDGYLQRLMLLSMGENLFFICLQLLKSLKKRVNIYQSVYFFWSFGFLIIRICFVGFCAARIHDESKEAKSVLYSVPHGSFCAETRRFLVQLTTNDVALTGCRFFSVTRGLLLTIAGTVVTYEIVLVQFNTDIGADSWPTDTNKTFCAQL